MQFKDAKELRSKWQKDGNKPCSHPELEKEYYLGSQGFDYICTICGEEFTAEEAKEHRKQQQ